MVVFATAVGRYLCTQGLFDDSQIFMAVDAMDHNGLTEEAGAINDLQLARIGLFEHVAHDYPHLIGTAELHGLNVVLRKRLAIHI